MSKDDLIHLKGIVTQVFSGGFMEIEIEDGKGAKVTGKLSGKMKKNRIGIIKNDVVLVSISPYNLKLGLITYRF